MNETFLDAARASQTPADRKLGRSAVFNQLRLNPFRVLHLPVSAPVDEAIWKAEETLTLLRAGLPPNEPNPLPWLPPPDEQEIRQAVQAIEEPLRRALEQLSWFDFANDPAGEVLQKALATLDPDDLKAYLDREQPAADGQSQAGIAAAINQANLRLLLAALSVTDSWPELTALESADEKPEAWEWRKAHGLQVVLNVHEPDFADNHRARMITAITRLWQDALHRWWELLKSPAFADFLKVRLKELGDDSVGEEDAETIINSMTTRLCDLLVGELKVQYLEGRLDRVQAFLKLAYDSGVASGIEPRRWVLALRPLRPLFRTELSELDALLGEGETGTTPRFENLEVYIARLGALSRRWSELDAGGLLGLGEIADEAAIKVNGILNSHQHYATADRLKALLQSLAVAAQAESTKQRIAGSVGKLDGLDRWSCHFCRHREADGKYSAVLAGKKETGRTRHFNSTTIYYSLRWTLVQRCERCADLHEYIRGVGIYMWVALGIFVAVFLYFGGLRFFENANPLVWGGIAIAFFWLSGKLARLALAHATTGKGERMYWDVKTARGYQDLTREGYGITLDYSKDAFDQALARSKK